MTSKWPTQRLDQLFDISSSKRVLKSEWTKKGVPFYRGREVSTLAKDGFVENELYISRDHFNELAERFGAPQSGDIVVTAIGTIGNTYEVKPGDEFYYKDASVLLLHPRNEVHVPFVKYWFQSSGFKGQLETGNGATVDTLPLNKLKAMTISLPPLDEQKRIVAKLDEAMKYQNQIRVNSLNTDQEVLDLASAITAEVLTKVGLEYGEDSLGNVFKIARGGSPRPIKDYLTDAEDGINWIKISDATRTGKYITDTEQKIKPEGVTRSRKVFPGDFLLSNSMSFGRPYILQTEGCIHDGWLVLSHNQHEFDIEFMYYALGSKYMYEQFNSLAYGSTVRNLNIDSASRAKVPLPPIAVQKKLSEEFRMIDELVTSVQQVNSEKRNSLADLKETVLTAAFAGEL